MSYRDSKVAVFYSPHMAGNVTVEYCLHQQMLALRYHTKDGVMLNCYDVTKPGEMGDVVMDAIAIAARPVKDRS